MIIKSLRLELVITSSAVSGNPAADALVVQDSEVGNGLVQVALHDQ